MSYLTGLAIIEHTSDRLILVARRPVWAVVIALFTLLSVASGVSVLMLGIPRLETMNPFQFLAWVAWLVLAVGLIYAGSSAFLSAAVGMTCVFDKADASLLLRRVAGLRVLSEERGIYGIKRVDVVYNEGARAYGLFLVLRTNEKLALATVPPHDEPLLREIAQTIRDFLWQPL